MMQSSLMTYRCPHCEQIMELEKVSDGETVTCTAPLCRREFQVKFAEAEPTPGLIIPDDQQDQAQQDDTVRATAGAKEDDADSAFAPQSKDDRVIATFPAPMFRRHPFYFVGCVLLGLLGIAALVVAVVRLSIPMIVLSLLPLAASIGLLAYWWWLTKQRTITVTASSLVINEGFLSEQTKEIHHGNITEIHIFQPTFCRLFRSGALLVEWGEDDGDKIYIDAVSDPHDLVKTIREQAQK